MFFWISFKSTMLGQTMFAEFERDTRGTCGETLTSEALCSAYELKSQLGEAMDVEG